MYLVLTRYFTAKCLNNGTKMLAVTRGKVFIYLSQEHHTKYA